MAEKEEFSPKNVHVQSVNKRGEWYSIKGHVDGKLVEAHIPAPTVESRSTKSADALIRRTLLGTHQLPQDGGSGARNSG